MKLTVISSLYNCSKFLTEAIRAGVSQNFKDYNWIIINDGSTDNTIEVLEELIDEILDTTIWLTNDGQNLGIGFRYNQALNKVTSEYACLLDGDDISEPSRFLTQTKFLDANKDYWLVGCKPLIIDENSLIDAERTSFYHHNIPISWEDIKLKLKDYHTNPIIHPSIMFRVDDFFNLGGYNPDEKLCPDLDLWCRAMEYSKKMYNLDYNLVRYRLHSNNLSGTKGKQMEEDRIRILKKYQFLKD